MQGLARVRGLDRQQERSSECNSGVGGYLSQHASRSVREVRGDLEQVSDPREWSFSSSHSLRMGVKFGNVTVQSLSLIIVINNLSPGEYIDASNEALVHIQRP